MNPKATRGSNTKFTIGGVEHELPWPWEPAKVMHVEELTTHTMPNRGPISPEPTTMESTCAECGAFLPDHGVGCSVPETPPPRDERLAELARAAGLLPVSGQGG